MIQTELTQDEIRTALDQHQAMLIADHLERHYPGHLWYVHVRDGLALVKAGSLDMTYCYVLHVDRIDNDYQEVTRAGGEVLERYGVKRGRINRDKPPDRPESAAGFYIPYLD